MRTFGKFLRELLATWWGRVFLFLGVVSTVTTYVSSFYPGFVLPRGVLLAISIVSWVIAPYDLYRRQRALIEKHGKAELVIYPESDSRYYVHVGEQPRQEVLGVYIEFYVTIENKGSRNAILREFGVSVQETQRSYDTIQPQARNNIQTRTYVQRVRENFILRGGSVSVRGYNFVTGIIPFYLEPTAVPADNPQCLHCTLTLVDTEGNRAQQGIEVQRGA